MNRLLGTIAISLVLLLSGAIGCGTPVKGGQGVDTASLETASDDEYPPQKPSRYLGKFVYQQRCASCHGQVGPAPDDAQFALRVPGYIRTADEMATDDANFKAWFEKQPKPNSPFYPEKQGEYVDLYQYTWFKNGSEFSFTDPNQAPLADMQLKEVYDMLSVEHGNAGKEV
ncbi:MAG: cytochrome c, partial [bacterium]